MLNLKKNIEKIISSVKESELNAKEYFEKANQKLIEVEKTKSEIAELYKRINSENSRNKIDLEIKEQALEKIISQKTIGFPWLANAISEFHEYFDLVVAEKLANKKYPATKASAAIKEMSKEKRLLKKKFKYSEQIIKYYENLFPWLRDYVDTGLDEFVIQLESESKPEKESEPIFKYIQLVEYRLLESHERTQKALNRYVASRKNNWQIGRDYERYIGYLYEQNGYDVVYTGIFDGYNDLGRDLICSKGDSTHIVQCKCWSRTKLIREKHINQLYGTTIKFIIDKNDEVINKYENSLFPNLLEKYNVTPVFYTSTKYSEEAKKFANALNVELHENVKLEKYPLIKCNISSTNEKIYHLPFDQQYDKIKINRNKDSFYEWTTINAEQKGFRHAYRWQGD